MPFYGCLFHGYDFRLTDADGTVITGFYTSRKTCAKDVHHAKQRLEESFWNEEKVQTFLKKSREQGANPKIVIEEIWGLSVWRYFWGRRPRGFTLYGVDKETSAGEDEKEPEYQIYPKDWLKDPRKMDQ